MNEEIVKQIEEDATKWFASQPMGSAVRQNGPAAMLGYIAGGKAVFNRCLTNFIKINDIDNQTPVKIDFNDSITASKIVTNAI